MKKLILAFVLALGMLYAHGQGIATGEWIDNISLLSVTGIRYDFNAQQDTKGFIVVFMTPGCDNCLLYRERIAALNDKYSKQGYAFVAISAYSEDPDNDPMNSPASINKWQTENKLDFPFLLDEKFKYTNLFGIKELPEVVLLKKTKKGLQVKYIGRIDDNPYGKEKSTKNLAELAIKKL